MSQEGANLPQDVQASHDHTTSTTTNTPVGSTKTDNSNSNSISSSVKSGENNAGSKLESPTVVGVNTGVGEKGKNAVVVDGVEVGGEGGGDGGSSSASLSKSKSSSDGGDHELKGVVTGAGKRGSGSGSGKSKGKSAARVEHELHIWTERERRKKMKNMFSSLHALLPQLPDKTDKASIVGEAITYIKTLEDTLQKLERMKLERMRARQRAGGGGGEASASAPPRAAPAVAPATREATLADMALGWNARQAAASGRAGSPAVPGAVTAPPPFQTWSGPNVVLNMAGDDAFITLSTPRQRGVFTTVLSVLEKHYIDVVTSTVSSDQNQKLFNLHVRVKQVNGTSSQSSESLTPEDKYKMAVSEIMLWLSN